MQNKQPQASVEEIIDKHISCTCNEGYKIRNLADPTCPRHSYGDSISDAIQEYASLLVAAKEQTIHGLNHTINLHEQSNDEWRRIIAAKEKEIEGLKTEIIYWQDCQREWMADNKHFKALAEAADAMYNAAKDWWEKELSLDGFEKLSKTYDKYQNLKNQTDFKNQENEKNKHTL